MTTCGSKGRAGMGRTYYLGADIGTTAIKAALFDDSGRKILHHAEEYDLIKPSAQD